jgi:hypothetical protein
MKWTSLMTGIAGGAVRARDVAPAAVTRLRPSSAGARATAPAA